MKFLFAFLLLFSLACHAVHIPSSPTFVEKPKVKIRSSYQIIGPSLNPCVKRNGQMFCGVLPADLPVISQSLKLVTSSEAVGGSAIDWNKVKSLTFHAEGWKAETGSLFHSSYYQTRSRPGRTVTKLIKALDPRIKNELSKITFPGEKMRIWLFEPDGAGNEIHDIELISVAYASEIKKTSFRFGEAPCVKSEVGGVKCVLPLGDKKSRWVPLGTISSDHNAEHVDWKCESSSLLLFELWDVETGTPSWVGAFDSSPQFRRWSQDEHAIMFGTQLAKEGLKRIGDKVRVRFNPSDIPKDNSTALEKIEGEMIMNAELVRFENGRCHNLDHSVGRGRLQ